MNQQPLALTNTTRWHDEGYTGKGITIAIIDDYGKPHDHMREYYTDQFGLEDKAGHGANVGYVLHQYAPGAKIIFLNKRKNDRNFEWLKKNKDKIDLINISQAMRAGLPTPEYERFKSLGIPIICASGNDGYDDHISYPARYDWTIAIGAYHWRKEGAYRNGVGGYSNGGKMLDAVAPSEHYLLDDNGRRWLVDGTSYASPAATGMLACYIQWRKENRLSKLNVAGLREFIANNCKDLYEEGHDYRSGHGLFILPDIKDLEKDLQASNKPNPEPSKPEQSIPTVSFNDIQSHWARTAIEWSATNKFISGYPDKTFKPNGQITRLEFALILSRLDEVRQAQVKYSSISFSDFTSSHKYYSIVHEICAKGFLSGKSNNQFAPNDSLTREELAVILTRLNLAMSKPKINNNINFIDVPSGHWAKSAIDNMSARDILKGFSKVEFGLGKSVTRAEIATILYRLHN